VSQYFNNIAPLYANVLFDYALASKKLDNIADDGQKIKEITKQDSELIERLSAPIYSDKEQQISLEKFVKTLGLSKTMERLLNILAKNKKLSSLIQILDYFEILLVKHQGNKIIEVTVAQELSKQQQDEIKEQLSELFKSKILITFEVDARIIGGIVIKENNKMIDASIASRFSHLVGAIKNNILQLELNK
jgi:F-type H+-transporting ATPase subunit delta